MKKFLKKFSVLFLAVVSLVSVTCFFGGKKSNDEISAEAGIYYYEKDQKYLSDIIEDGGTNIKSYNMANYYPLVAENQTTSNLCWMYSSLKALETSFMVQTGEYYNFSEVGETYLYYANTSSLSMDFGSNFNKFVEIYQDYGLVLESDFSNTEYQAINSNNDAKTYYSYVNDYATKKYNSFIKPYNVATSEYYTSFDLENKRTIVKNFILNYGAVFAGIEGGNKGTASNPNYVGCFYFDDAGADNIYNFYSYERAQASYTKLNGDHAITLVGWNDDISFGSGKTGAFIAMNSWGFEPGRTDITTGIYNVNSCEYFYIPYDYEFLYNTIGGFIINKDASQDVEVVSSSTSGFSKILTNAIELNNYFCYDDTISLTYKINDVDFNNLKIKISNSSIDFTSYFKLYKDKTQNTITVTLRDDLTDFYGGYYTIDFYNNDELIGKKSLYIFSGTEIGSFKFMYNVDTSSKTDTYALNNAFLSLNNTATIYVSGIKNYYFLSFNYATLTSYGRISENENYSYNYIAPEISNISVISLAGTTQINTSDLFLEDTTISSSVNNTYFYQIGNRYLLSNFKNSLLRFKITISSALYNCKREFIINMFVSELGTEKATTSKLTLIRYELDGGLYDAENITKYPSALNDETFEKIDANMTSITLKNPTKNGYEFVGWYLNSDFTGDMVTQITKLNGNIVLYAKWIEKTGQEYFSLSLTFNSVLNHLGVVKSLPVVYGDSVKLELELIENPESGISSYDYQAMYYLSYYRLNGTQKEKEQLVSGDMMGNNHIVKIDYPNLVSGNIVFTVDVVVYIGNHYQVSLQSSPLTVNVEKKQVSFTFSDNEKTYSGFSQKPTVTAAGFFEENYESLYTLKCNNDKNQAKDAATYIFYIDSVNENYSFDVDSSRCEFKILQKSISVTWKDGISKTLTYDGKNHFPAYEFSADAICSGDVVRPNFNYSECKDAGTYNIKILSVDNSNYKITNTSFIEDYVLTINPASIKITFYNTTDRIQTKIGKRKTPKYNVEGDYVLSDDLQIQIITQALSATKSGTYQISCSVGNENYDSTVKTATYTLTGYYYVYYQLSNGITITERVEEGQKPKGVSKDDFDASRFSSISYSDDFDLSGKDLFISVTLKDYSGLVYSAIFVVVFLLVCLIYYLKRRESKVR